jgi:hypothetical protein
MSIEEGSMEKGFVGSLFDLSFTNFVTPKLIKILYIASLVFLGFMYVVVAVLLFASEGDTTFNTDTGTIETSGGSAVMGVFWLLILGPLCMFFYTLLFRVFFELVIVFFRIYESSREQVILLRGQSPEATIAPAQPAGQTSPPQQPAS